jgi:hypothetical protein
VPTWRVCPFLETHIQGSIEEVKVDQEVWEKFGVCGEKECCRGLEGATLLIHLHGNGPG